MSSSDMLNTLPTELLIDILKRLPTTTDIMNMAKTNKYLHDIMKAHERTIAKRIIKNERKRLTEIIRPTKDRSNPPALPRINVNEINRRLFSIGLYSIRYPKSLREHVVPPECWDDDFDLVARPSKRKTATMSVRHLAACEGYDGLAFAALLEMAEVTVRRWVL